MFHHARKSIECAGVCVSVVLFVCVCVCLWVCVCCNEQTQTVNVWSGEQAGYLYYAQVNMLNIVCLSN